MIYEFFAGSFNTILEMFKSGGVITYIITIIGIYGIFYSAEKIYYLRKISQVGLPQIMSEVNKAMDRGGSLEALRSIGRYQNPISKIVAEALKIGFRSNREVEDAMERVFIVEMGRMTKGMDTIRTIIEIAPLLGLIGTVLGMWYTFKAMGVNASATGMAEGIYVALITTIMGLAVAIIILPLYTHINSKIEDELDKIEIAKKMTNWRSAEMRIKVDSDIENVITALKESDGVIEVKELHQDKDANIWISMNPHMLEKSIGNVIREKCNTEARVVESKLKQ
ncbi:MAG: MotA/TolQ/ExbB proton channel family protein [Methanobacterium formicicum]|jgi:biopolymer transport protein ExbB|uniref:MotA/TolQ/ExbB proton channel family protein n=1 Tax=Methanobacterium formicicum TaxID=2162 RepID=A0A090I3Q6_METFO|nr:MULTISPECIES: MotA/TolQ/ExbB proton channel family protein [Methanobacterium]AIS32897.1 transporter MotA/TolQ/ExbB proton channel family [Methanobacterium formicicum]MBF4475153.1 MotA/TolQ/ExbB proton channel family protein [Methanobacterium formicicum]MDD4810858.1 MotA/TolQ/ExbB proton channel family protein [Methanobacterium formicicum]MDG3546805.1 MotA/TolQ/ExbB proton channel family protein [Methanobacterium formicicum]MDH2660481.1 MotA/TolQ/ExbB proton channel family protein [Methanoba